MRACVLKDRMYVYTVLEVNVTSGCQWCGARVAKYFNVDLRGAGLDPGRRYESLLFFEYVILPHASFVWRSTPECGISFLC